MRGRRDVRVVENVPLLSPVRLHALEGEGARTGLARLPSRSTPCTGPLLPVRSRRVKSATHRLVWCTPSYAGCRVDCRTDSCWGASTPVTLWPSQLSLNSFCMYQEAECLEPVPPLHRVLLA